MQLYDMELAISEARRTLSAADISAESMARLIVGRLRKVDCPSTLASLKSELKNYNAHTGKWKN